MELERRPSHLQPYLHAKTLLEKAWKEALEGDFSTVQKVAKEKKRSPSFHANVSVIHCLAGLEQNNFSS